ncbi:MULTISPECIES: hypothetical protein [Amycolatopsis]|uniref:Uncharacterized protein n=1 Tax=Amycolatopsis dendrobii TaxID=2760662 RepID=A0A7W3Z915_9PSEU|nr:MULTISPECIES: hypothetical protein [Amycolatopsis]MBB1152249.1 hypothetical protein [Amycolatopsis dendrobii]UKD57477.1 hypothetical protein L3Q65_12370 [Amycolatopsis sp. FU40]
MVDDRVVRILRRTGAAEVIDALLTGPACLSRLRRTVPRRTLERSVRALAAEGALVRADAGSWDTGLRADTELRLTASGLAVAAVLSDWDVWVRVYEDYLRDR